MHLATISDSVLVRFKRLNTLKLDTKGYLTVWLYFVFITSVVVTNTVKGTTVAFLMAYGALAIPLLTKSKQNGYYYYWLSRLLLCYFGLCVASQLAVLLADHLTATAGLILVSPERSFFLKTSLFTQSLYVIPSFALLCFTAFYYVPTHERHLARALLLFAGFGFYKVLFYALFGTDGDFLSNRMFGDGIENPAQFQLLIVAGKTVSRFVSLTGESSMYVYAVFPYFVFFLYRRRFVVALVLFVSLILTASGTFAMALFLLGLFHFLLAERNLKRASALLIGGVLLGLLIPAEIRSGLLNELLFDKINQQSVSGIERTQNFVDQMAFFTEMPWLNKLVGVGFGTIRSTDLFSTLLVNTGIVGFGLFTLLFAVPIYLLSRQDNGLRIALLITYFILQVSVSEYSYPSLWLLLGLAYNTLLQNERLRQRALSNTTHNRYTAVRH